MPSMTTTMTRTLLIVDDHPSFRTFARALLGAEGFEVTGEADNGEAALLEVARLRPDVVLLDVQLPGIDGIEVAAELARDPDGPQVVLTSSRDASDYGSRLIRAQVSGFIPKRELSGAALAALVS
jgi:two-component system, NarL family, nitrate/nitrite response regulator NarL